MGHPLNAPILLVAAAVWSLPLVASGQPARGERAVAPAISKGAPTTPDPKSNLDLQKLILEVAKLESEVRKLESESQDLAAARSQQLDAELGKLRAETLHVPPWWGTLVGALLGFLAVALTGFIAWRQALKAKVGAFDMKVFEARMAGYGKLVAATDVLALYAPHRLVDKATCQLAALRLKADYFGLTGLLLTKESKERYLALAHALMRAATTDNLRVPADTAQLREWWDDELLKNERTNLGLEKPGKMAPDQRAQAENNAVNNHQFGDPRTHPAADFIVLQFAASRFRSALIDDIQSRRELHVG
jgi:hypothetical protein